MIDFEVLGCHGGELPGRRTTSFLIDGKLAIDAGALCEALELPRLLEVDHVVLTHSHFDHVKGLPLMADLLVGARDEPVVVHASPDCVDCLRRDVFNDRLWPDFTRLPSPSRPVLRLEPFTVGKSFSVGPYTITSRLVNHPVEAVGLVVEKAGSALAVSGDTGPTEAFWEMVNGRRDLRLLLLETSFPDALADLARASGHLTPAALEREVSEKLTRPGLDIRLYHLKPAYLDLLYREIGALNLPGVRILETGQKIAV